MKWLAKWLIRDELNALADAITRNLEVPDGPRGGVAGSERLEVNLGPLEQSLEQHETAISQLRHEVARLHSAVATGLSDADRREKRIRATIRRARTELEAAGVSDPALEAEWGQLEPVGDGQEELELPVHPPDPWEGEDENEPSSIPGVSRAALRKARGW